MSIFLIAVCVLILGYLIYGVIVERILGIDRRRKTPALTMQDGVDFVPLKPGKIFLIQFLNIAGLGPVFGAILGALYGPICLFWIVLGSIFAGGVHDMLSGVISIHNKGCTVATFVQKYCGRHFHYIFLGLMTFLLTLVGSIFAQTPAHMLSNMSGWHFSIWLAIIFGYYFLATLLPIDKIIGRFYPIFGSCLILSTILLLGVLVAKGIDFYPQASLHNQHPQQLPVFPLMFITIACGALSGFHATQSPMMARCLTNEKYCRPVFYGAMILEGFIALIWATLGIAFYQGSEGLSAALGPTGNTGFVVSDISKNFLGQWGGLLAILSVIFLAITTGDTALRSARLSCADCFHLNQKNLKSRLGLSAVVLGIAIAMAFINLKKIWLYFGWSNQLLACIMLWIGALYLSEHKRNIWIAVIPAIFITSVCGTYLGYADLFLGMPLDASIGLGLCITLGVSLLFVYRMKQLKK